MKDIQILQLEAVKEVKAKYYNDNVKLAKFCRKIATGKDHENYILRLKAQWQPSYKDDMDDSEKKNHTREQEFVIKLYNDRTKAAYGKIRGYFERVFRVDKKAQGVDFDDPNNNNNEAIANALANFGGTNVVNFLDYEYLYANGIDPNAWLLIEQETEGKLQPIVIPSKMVQNYHIKNGVLFDLTITETLRDTNIKRYTIYQRAVANAGKGIKIILTEDNDDLLESDLQDGSQKRTIDNKAYWVYQESLPLNYIMAIRLGYLANADTNGKTFAPFWDDASSYMKDLIDRKFQLDVSYNLHTFLKLVQFRQKCNYHNSKGQCNGGVMSHDQSTCPSCDGSGLKRHKSGQDIITMEMPESKEEMVLTPDKIAAYIDMPFRIVEEQRDQVEKLPNQATKAVLGIDPDKETVSGVTATEIQSMFGVAYDVLNKFADGYTHVYNFVVQCVLDYFNVKGKPKLTFPNEFGLESEGLLIQLLKSAKDAGAPSDVIDNIEQRIAAKQNKGNLDAIRERQSLAKFMPFKHLSQEQADTEVSNMPLLHPHRVTYLYFDQLSERVLEENTDFAIRNQAQQRELFKSVLDDFIEELREYQDELSDALRETQIEGIEEETEEETNQDD